MLFKSLPNPNDRILLSRFLWEDETLVVHDLACRASYRRHVAPLSLKTVRCGAESYNVHGFDEIIHPGECLVVNEGQSYSSAIASGSPVETVCLFFSARDVFSLAQLELPESDLLDEPTRFRSVGELPAVKRRMSAQLQQLLGGLSGLRIAPRLRQEEFSLTLLAAVWAMERSERRTRQMTAVRASTRGELYRRCSVARSYLRSHLSENVCVSDLARVAGLSRAHFLRAFSQCFGETPYQFLRRERLNRAAALLRSGGRSVSEIAASVGYSDFSAFARAFRRFHGIAPSAW